MPRPVLLAMTPRAMRGLPLVAALVVATAQGEPIELRYHAPERCPGREAFLSELRARTPRAVIAAAPEALRLFEVSIRLQDGAYAGRVDIRDRAGDVMTRSFSDENCAEVASALSLVAALAIDPNASTAPVPAAPAPSAPASASASAPPPPPPRPERPPPAKAAREPRRSLGAEGLLATSLGPRPSLGAGVAGGLRSTRPGLFAPSFQAGVEGAFASPGASGDDRVTTRLVAVHADGCPIAGRLGERLIVSPCVATDAGILFARGVNVPQPERAARGVWTLGALGRARYVSPSGLFAQAGAALMAPVVRYRFVVSQSPEVAYTMPPLAVAVTLGAGVEF